MVPFSEKSEEGGYLWKESRPRFPLLSESSVPRTPLLADMVGSNYLFGENETPFRFLSVREKRESIHGGFW